MLARLAVTIVAVAAILATDATAQQRQSTYEEQTLLNGHGRLLGNPITSPRDCMAQCIAHAECGYWVHIDLAGLSCRLHAGEPIQRQIGGDRLRLHTSGQIVRH